MAELRGMSPPLIVGRYELHGEIARGGMATVHLGRILSDAGFSRTVAIKRLHPQCAGDPAFAAMFVDEARLASRIHHPNVVSTLDVVVSDGELFVVMEYVQGESLSRLTRLQSARGFTPVEYVVAVGAGVLDGLHAAHEAVSETDEPLGIVHRDVSPQNILVGVDGVPRIIDFGVAKAARRLQTTRAGQLKGKLRYMPPEQFAGAPPDRRSDLYATAIVLWEALTGKRLFDGETDAESVGKILRGASEPPSFYAAHVPPALDDVVMCGLAIDPTRRFATAHDMALALEGAVSPASARRLGEWVRSMAADSLSDRAKHILEIESNGSSGVNVKSVLGSTGAGRASRMFDEGPPASQAMSQTFVPHRHAMRDEGPKEVSAVWLEPEPEVTDVRRAAEAASDPEPEPDSIPDPPRAWSDPPPPPFDPPTVPRDPAVAFEPRVVPSQRFSPALPAVPAPQAVPLPPPPRRSFPSMTGSMLGDRATPVNPLPAARPLPPPAPPPAPPPPISVRQAPSADATGPRTALASPDAAPRSFPTPPESPPPMGVAWQETWDGAAWTVVFRPVATVIVALFGTFVVILAAFIFSQLALFGMEGVVGLVLGLAASGFVLMRMIRSTAFRIDAAGLRTEIRPSGTATVIPGDRIRTFLVVDDPSRRDPSLFCVHALLTGGDFEQLDVELPTDADARFVANRLNAMLADARAAAGPNRAFVGAPGR